MIDIFIILFCWLWLEIWQIGTKLTDMYGNIIPGIVRVRRIGEIL